jgi:hypothetical protein
MKLIITIDTEEDNWGQYAPRGHTLGNIEKIPHLQDIFDSFHAKPTYLVTYPVATDETSISLLREIEKSGRCEIGMHCHPWNTPPFEEDLNEGNSMLCNLPHDLQHKKLSILHNTIRKNFGIDPVSFRSGRWGYDQRVAENLFDLGYKVDTSITPYIDWTNYSGRDFSSVPPQPFRFSRENAFAETAAGQLLEVPATIGYLQRNFARCNKIHKFLSRKPINRLRIIGILHRLHLLNKVWLSPEQSDSKQMIKLTNCLIKKKYKIINLFFHSTALKAGLTDYVRTVSDEKRFIQQIEEFLAFTNRVGVESVRLSDAYSLIE